MSICSICVAHGISHPRPRAIVICRSLFLESLSYGRFGTLCAATGQQSQLPRLGFRATEHSSRCTHPSSHRPHVACAWDANSTVCGDASGFALSELLTSQSATSTGNRDGDPTTAQVPASRMPTNPCGEEHGRLGFSVEKTLRLSGSTAVRPGQAFEASANQRVKCSAGNMTGYKWVADQVPGMRSSSWTKNPMSIIQFGKDLSMDLVSDSIALGASSYASSQSYGQINTSQF